MLRIVALHSLCILKHMLIEFFLTLLFQINPEDLSDKSVWVDSSQKFFRVNPLGLHCTQKVKWYTE